MRKEKTKTFVIKEFEIPKDRNIKIADWSKTKYEFDSLISDLNERMKNFSNDRVFLKEEIGRLGVLDFKYWVDKDAFSDGMDTFERGENPTIDFLEIDITESKPERLKKIPFSDYLRQFAKGFATKKFYYYVIKKSELLNKNKEVKPQQIKHTKLKWLGSKTQLYSVLRILKKDYELIGNSFNELADFLIENVVSFESTSKETVEKELKKVQNPPKNKRILIDKEKLN